MRAASLRIILAIGLPLAVFVMVWVFCLMPDYQPPRPPAVAQPVVNPQVQSTSAHRVVTHTTPDPTPPVTSPEPTKIAASTATPKVVSRTVTKDTIIVHEASGEVVTYPNLKYTTQATTNDPYSGQSWETAATLPAARNVGAGSYVPKVAVIDTGVALSHQDLSGVWIANAGELGATTNEGGNRYNCTDRALALNKSCNNIDDDFDGIVDNESGATTAENKSQLNCTSQAIALNKSCNNLDDDGNGLIDDYRGYDFANKDRSVLPGEVNPAGAGVSHGTLVSGVIAAVNNNNIGIAGVSPNAKILPLQVLEDDGAGYTSSIADAIYYAVVQNVDVINLSLGGNTTDPYLKQAINYANQQGVVVVAASGNDGCACATYPAAFSAAIAVGATDSSRQLASFSNWGDFVDITAPGVNLYTTSWSQSNQTTSYRYASGTSLSTPVATGTVALLLSRYPTASPLQIKALLYEQANRTGFTSTKDVHYGYGALDSAASMTRATTPLIGQIYGFGAVRTGQDTNAGLVRTETKQDTTYICDKPGSTIKELTKGSQIFNSASETEQDTAITNGYAARSLLNVCVLMDYDTPDILRTMNMFQEVTRGYLVKT